MLNLNWKYQYGFMTFKIIPLKDQGEMTHKQQKHTEQLGLYL